MALCNICKRVFVHNEALKQHMRDAPGHKGAYHCDPCNRRFTNENALEQHIRYSPAHAISYNCNPCNQLFASYEALEQHLQDSPAHRTLHNTPLDRFFQSFSTFAYDQNLPPAESFSQLRAFYGWRRNDADSSDAWDNYQSALMEELELWFGADDDLVAWHALCRAIRISPLPTTPKDCKKAVRRKHVNIVDLIDWSRRGGDDGETNVRIFKSLGALREYTKRTGKIFRNTFKGPDNKNIVLRHLLRVIF